MRKQNRSYSLLFKQKAVELSYAKGNVKQVCEKLDIPYSVLHRWRKESRLEISKLLHNSVMEYFPVRHSQINSIFCSIVVVVFQGMII